MAMQANVQIDGVKATIKLSGRFDFSSHREFRNACEETLKNSEANEIVVDFGGVEYMDSSALGMLLLLKEKVDETNKKISLINCRGTILQILEVANFHKLFTILNR